MITGFNTDIEFGGVTYHIQTEDKGLNTPVIISLVYDRGTILASKRAPYDDLIEAGFDEKKLSDRLKKQHKTICAAIKKGRIDEIRSLSENVKNGKSKRAKARVPDSNILDLPPVKTTKRPTKPDIGSPSGGSEASAIPIPEVAPSISALPAPSPIEPVIDEVTVFEEAAEIPVEAVRIVSDLAGTERPENTKLSVEFIGDADFRGGRNCNVTVMICRGSQRKVIEGAEVMVKVLGSSFRPLIFHSHSDRNGISNVAVRLPNFSTGRASIMVRAMNRGEEVEIRRTVSCG